MKPRRWLTLPPLLIVAVAMACWAVPGSAAVQSPAVQSPAVQSRAVHRLAPAAVRATPSCNPVASSLRPTGPPQVTPGSFMAKIRARGYLIAGVSQSTYPFGFVEPLNGKTEGFDIDMVHAIAKAIFGNPNKIEFKAISDDQRIPEVQSGAVDIVAHTMTINCARLQAVDFSTVYFKAGQQVLVLKDSRVKSLAGLGGKKVCATAGSTSIANIKAASSHPIPVPVTNFTDCLVLLQQGDVAAISTDNDILAGLAAQDPWTKIVGPVFTSEPYGLAISKQHPDFVQFVNAVLQQLRTDGQWAASYAHWVGTPVPAPPPARYKA
ncbi:MAG TPA: transporter substrate-binding domain-containing protein [Streptosporangiaceae bacterium]|nr:transporter substrate-binding domain-containing protein [Streptosporangiaceae bacterium]